MEQARLPDGRFPAGVSGNPDGQASRRRRHDRVVATFEAELGPLSAGDHLLLLRAVDLLVSRAASQVDRTRAINTGHRIIETIRRRQQQAKREQAKPAADLDEYLGA